MPSYIAFTQFTTRSASLALYRSATTTGLLEVIAQDIEVGLTA
jgi:hypothetical protein